MDYDRTLAELRRELERVDAAIQALQEVRSNPASRSRRGRRSMGAQERSAVSERMRRYWQARHIQSGEPAEIPADRIDEVGRAFSAEAN